MRSPGRVPLIDAPWAGLTSVFYARGRYGREASADAAATVWRELAASRLFGAHPYLAATIRGPVPVAVADGADPADFARAAPEAAEAAPIRFVWTPEWIGVAIDHGVGDARATEAITSRFLALAADGDAAGELRIPELPSRTGALLSAAARAAFARPMTAVAGARRSLREATAGSASAEPRSDFRHLFLESPAGTRQLPVRAAAPTFVFTHTLSGALASRLADGTVTENIMIDLRRYDERLTRRGGNLIGALRHSYAPGRVTVEDYAADRLARLDAGGPLFLRAAGIARDAASGLAGRRRAGAEEAAESVSPIVTYSVTRKVRVSAPLGFAGPVRPGNCSLRIYVHEDLSASISVNTNRGPWTADEVVSAVATLFPDVRRVA